MSYQGYTNYATWLIQLELGDDLTSRGELNLGLTDPEVFRDTVEEIVENDSQLAISYAMRFLAEVDWRQLAKQAEEYIVLELPWSGDSGTFDELVADANKSWDDEDIQFLLDQNEEYLDKLSPDAIERLESFIG